MKTQTNIYPVDAPYGNGTIHYFNIVDRGESNEEGWQRYEADYEIIDNESDASIYEKRVKTLYRKYTPATYDQIQSDIDLINQIKGYPDSTGTLTYAQVPEEVVEKDEEGNAIDSFKLLKCTHDLQEALIEKGGLDLPMVSVEIIGDSSILIQEDTILNVQNLDILPENVKNYVIPVTRDVLENASMEVVEILLGDGNNLGSLL